jgi:hypothetical protein
MMRFLGTCPAQKGSGPAATPWCHGTNDQVLACAGCGNGGHLIQNSGDQDEYLSFGCLVVWNDSQAGKKMFYYVSWHTKHGYYMLDCSWNYP